MKSLLKNSLILALVASFVALYSCKTEDPEDVLPAMPSITISGPMSSQTEFEVGDSVAITVNFTTPGELSSFNYQITINKDSADEQVQSKEFKNPGDLGFDGTETSDSFNWVIFSEIPETLEGKMFTVELEIVDKANQIATAEFEFEVIISDPEARSYSAVLLAAPTGNFENKNFFSVSSGTTYSKSQVMAATEAISATIDFGYYYGGASDLASIATPKAFETITAFAAQVEGWNVKNETILKTTTLTAAQFLEITTFGAIEVAFAAGTTDANGIITNLTEGTVLAFQTVGGVKGLILISEIEAGFESNDYVKIDVIAQLDAE